MPSKKLVKNNAADELKQVYGINKNISDNLSKKQQDELLFLLQDNNSIVTLVESFLSKNNELANNNRRFGQQREKAKRELVDEQDKNKELTAEVLQLKSELEGSKNQLINVLESFH